MKLLVTLVSLLTSLNAVAFSTQDTSCAELQSLVAQAGAQGVEIQGNLLGLSTTATVYATRQQAHAACSEENYHAYCGSSSYVVKSADSNFCTIGRVAEYNHASEN